MLDGIIRLYVIVLQERFGGVPVPHPGALLVEAECGRGSMWGRRVGCTFSVQLPGVVGPVWGLEQTPACGAYQHARILHCWLWQDGPLNYFLQICPKVFPSPSSKCFICPQNQLLRLYTTIECKMCSLVPCVSYLFLERIENTEVLGDTLCHPVPYL